MLPLLVFVLSLLRLLPLPLIAYAFTRAIEQVDVDIKCAAHSVSM